MYGEDYLDQLFTAVYYTPTGSNALLRNPGDPPVKTQKKYGVTKKLKGPGSTHTTGKHSHGSSKFVNNIRQHSSGSRSSTLPPQRRPVSAPVKKKSSRAYKPKEASKIAPYASYVKRRQEDYAHTEPIRQMSSTEYPMFPVLAETQPVAETPSRVTYSEPPEADVVAQESSHFVDTAANNSMTSDRPSTVNGVQKYSKRPYDLDKQYTDMNEWIGLRQNYIHQIESLEKYERMCGASQVLSEISMTNFYSLLTAIRKITIRIADHYRMIVLQKETPLNLLEVHSYVVSMATDMDVLDRQPFIDWTGLHFTLNPFVCGYRIDGNISTAMADLNVVSKKTDLSNPAMIPTELVMDQFETSECRDLGAVIWGAYTEDQRKRKAQREQDEVIKEQLIQSSVRKAELALKREAFEFAGPQAMEERSRVRAWAAWKKAFDLSISIRNMASVRSHIIKRNVFATMVRHMWVSQNFRRMLRRRADNLIEMTFQGWYEYLMWCREFNRVRYGFCLHHKQYCFYRLKLLVYNDDTVRAFKRKRRLRPIFLTFRALKRYSLVEGHLRKTRLKNGSSISFANLNLRYFMFSRWEHFSNISRCVEQVDVVCKRVLKRMFFKTWRVEVFGLGFRDHIKHIVAATSAKIAESVAPEEEGNAPATNRGSHKWSAGKLLSRSFSSLLKR